MEKHTAVLESIQAWLKEEGFEPDIVEQDGLPMLRVLLPVLEDGRGLVLVEIFITEYSDVTNLAHIFSTMTPGSGAGLDELSRVINHWNLTSLVGGYGIYEEHGLLFHRHTVAVSPTDEAEDVKEDILRGLFASLDEMGRRLPEVIVISNDEPAE